MAPSAEAPVALFTVGHSTRPIDELLALLAAHRVRRLIDVRTVPRSARHPQFDQLRLRASVEGAGLAYEHLPGLGGLRKPRKHSRNTAWRNDGFRGFADYMETEAFARELDGLIERARREPVAILCAEAAPWRCHRSLIADALVARGITVRHILGDREAPEHRPHAQARIEGGRVSYPGPVRQGSLWELGDSDE
jgi:uncharacterized protein (DUF488 family)